MTGGVGERLPRASLSGEVNDPGRFDKRQQRSPRLGFCHIAKVQLRSLVEPSRPTTIGVNLRMQIVEHVNGVALVKKPATDFAADETCATGDQNDFRHELDQRVRRSTTDRIAS